MTVEMYIADFRLISNMFHLPIDSKEKALINDSYYPFCR